VRAVLSDKEKNTVNKLSLKVKLGLGFGGVLLILAIMGTAACNGVGQLSDISDRVVKAMTQKDLASQVHASIEMQSTGVRGFLLSGRDDTLQHDDAGKKQLAESMETLRQTIVTDEGRRLQDEVQQNYAEWRPIADSAIALRRAGKIKQAEDALFTPHANETRTKMRTAVADFGKLEEKLQESLLSEQRTVALRVRLIVLMLGLVGVMLGFGISVFVVRAISSSIARMLTLIQEIAANNLTVADMEITSEDELGRAGAALNGMKNNLHQTIQSIRRTAEQVAAASEQLSATGQQITANSEETTAQARVVSEAGGQVYSNLQTLASGAEEMNSTIGEIAKNASEAAQVAGEAVIAAESANRTVSKLGDSSVEIEKVIEVITSIAQQTNLLALNATIEAARAGEAGKGFAVVANEVKELAKQTAKATEEIKQKIAVIRENTGGAVEAIGGIKGVIDKVSHISTVIATAVEEQSATTSEMARNVTEAARGASTISENIRGVAEAAQSTSTNVGESQTASEHLARMASQLRELVGNFKVDAASEPHQGTGMKALRKAAGAR
jgi:methyl-accepting chemotaxis protein